MGCRTQNFLPKLTSIFSKKKKKNTLRFGTASSEKDGAPPNWTTLQYGAGPNCLIRSTWEERQEKRRREWGRACNNYREEWWSRLPRWDPSTQRLFPYRATSASRAVLSSQQTQSQVSKLQFSGCFSYEDWMLPSCLSSRVMLNQPRGARIMKNNHLISSSSSDPLPFPKNLLSHHRPSLTSPSLLSLAWLRVKCASSSPGHH